MAKPHADLTEEEYTQLRNDLESGLDAQLSQEDPEMLSEALAALREYETIGPKVGDGVRNLVAPDMRRDSTLLRGGMPQTWVERSPDEVAEYLSANPDKLKALGARKYDFDERTGALLPLTETNDLYKRGAELMYTEAYDHAKASGNSLTRVRDMKDGFEKKALQLLTKVQSGVVGALQGIPGIGSPAVAAFGKMYEDAGMLPKGGASAMTTSPDRELGSAGAMISRMAGGIASAGPILGAAAGGGAAPVGAPTSSILQRALASSAIGGGLGAAQTAGDIAGDAIVDRPTGDIGSRMALGTGLGMGLGGLGELAGAGGNRATMRISQEGRLGEGVQALRKAGGETTVFAGHARGKELSKTIDDAYAKSLGTDTVVPLQERVLRTSGVAERAFKGSRAKLDALAEADSAFKLGEGAKQFHSTEPLLAKGMEIVARRGEGAFAKADAIAKELPRLVETKSVPAKAVDAMLDDGWRVLPREMEKRAVAGAEDAAEGTFKILGPDGRPMLKPPPQENVTLFRPKKMNAQQLDEEIHAIDRLANAGSKDGARDRAYEELQGAIRETRDQFSLGGKAGGWSELKRQEALQLDAFGSDLSRGVKGLAGDVAKKGSKVKGPAWQDLTTREREMVQTVVAKNLNKDSFHEAMSALKDDKLLKELRELRATGYLEELTSASRPPNMMFPVTAQMLKLRSDPLARAAASTLGATPKPTTLSNRLLTKLFAMRGGSAGAGVSGATEGYDKVREDTENLMLLIETADLIGSATGKEKDE